MATTEHSINDALAQVLAATRGPWRAKDVVRAENIGVLKGAGTRPDVLVAEPSVSPVVIETEVVPAVSVESDALNRLGQQLAANGRPLLSSLAVRLPARLRSHSGPALQQAVADADDFEMCLFTGPSPADFERWPSNGWIRGSALDMSMLAQAAAVPPAVIRAAADKLIDGVTDAAGLLNNVAATNPQAVQAIARHLLQHDGEQTRKMAVTILANALLFQEHVAGGPGGLGSVLTRAQMRALPGGIATSNVLAEWDKILGVNYWAIFDIAKRILTVIPAPAARPILDRLAATADSLIHQHFMRSHDVTGEVFQSLIADRKFLAAFYTTPASAALLAGLAIHPGLTPGGGAWADPEGIAALRVGDLACGTGTLLSTAYHRISQLHEAAGGDSELLHPRMMATAFVGCDVLPAAAHLTASMLAGAHPTVTFDRSSILTVEYGAQAGGRVALGSLDLVSAQQAFDALEITGALAPVAAGQALGGSGQQQKDLWLTIPHASFDLILMNPPFTRDTGQEGPKVGVSNPMFAAFAASASVQKRMSAAREALFRGSSAHGNAGEASDFLVLADRKLKPGGTLGLVMPLSLMLGDAWENSRRMLRGSYGNLILVTIAAEHDQELSFSADTGMAECLLVGQRLGEPTDRATFVVLSKKPDSTIAGWAAAAQVLSAAAAGNIRKLEDGPVGGTPLHLGGDTIGYALDAPLGAEGAWKVARIADPELAQVAHQLIDRNRAWLPGTLEAEAQSVGISTVRGIGSVGPYHMDVNGDTATGGIRGPFSVTPKVGPGAPTYPILWAHHAPRERAIEFEGEAQGGIRQGATPTEDAAVRAKADAIWRTASHLHFNRDFRLNSQSTAMQFTPSRTIGGRAWPSITLSSEDHEKALALWSNSTLGILLHWWHANKQQAGRGSIGVSALATLPVLDVTKMSKASLASAVAIFDDLRHNQMRPINEIDRDSARAEIDRRLYCEVLGFPAAWLASGGPFELMRRKLALEPSISGGKAAGLP